MNEISHGFDTLPDGLSVASAGEMDQVEGGKQTTMGAALPNVDGTAAGYWELVRYLDALKYSFRR